MTDGNPGVLKAIAEVFPRSLKQRCQKHRLENILGKAPTEVRDELKAAILESFHANSYEQGLKKGREVIARYRQRFPSAMKCMEETLEACLQALRLPAAHHKRLRTSNLLERTFGEHKRRTKQRPARHVGGISSLTERGEPYGDLTGKLRGIIYLTIPV